MILLNNVSKKHAGQARPVLDQVSAVFEAGRISVIMGASGTGKTTLLNCILQLEAPDSGTIEIQTTRQPENSIPMTGVLQTPALFQHLTVMENLTIAPKNVLKKSPEIAGFEAMNMLVSMGLEDKAHQYPAELSGGECQRISIARSLLMNPQVLVLDEPTNALNEEYIQHLSALLKICAAKGMTIIVSTHHLVFAHRIADQLFTLENGRLEKLGHDLLAKKITKANKIKLIQPPQKEQAIGC